MKLVRLVSWVTKDQKKKVKEASKVAKKRDYKASESAIIRRLIDTLKI
jgi:hypothetical protein